MPSTPTNLGGAEKALWDASLWMGALMVVLAASAVALTIARRYLRDFGKDETDTLSLQDLRTLRDAGRLSAAEYERLRNVIASTAVTDRKSQSPRNNAR